MHIEGFKEKYIYVGGGGYPDFANPQKGGYPDTVNPQMRAHPDFAGEIWKVCTPQ